MIDVGEELAVQSFCFRAFKDNAKVADMVKECGLSSIELCGAHVDMAAPDTFEATIKVYHDSGVEMPCIGVCGFGDDEAAARRYFEFAHLVGARCIGADFRPANAPDCFKLGERLAEEYGIPLAIHNHGGRHWLGSAQILRTVFDRTGPMIGLCLDTAWALDSHEDPVAMARKFADRLRMIHLKDFVFDRTGKPEDVVVGRGVLDLPGFFTALKEMAFDGCATLEYEGDVDDPVPSLRECVKSIRETWSQA